MQTSTHFYPRPPRGGRQHSSVLDDHDEPISIHALREEGDPLIRFYVPHDRISIHALREEGDSYFLAQAGLSKIFLSTPSARRVTTKLKTSADLVQISIHALCEEGDSKNRDKISIFL